MEGKVLIANRGEIAIRVMNVCSDLGLDYVVVYTEADKDSGHVQQNTTSGKNQNAWRITSYIDANELFAVADHTGCTAIHPGYGYLTEDFRFARRAANRDRPLTFIGPHWEAIQALGNKINAKKLAKKLNIPTVPGNDSPIRNEVEAENIALTFLQNQQQEGIKNPAILIKPAIGSGGLGIAEVSDLSRFSRVYRQVQNYGKNHFGDNTVLIEKCYHDCNHLAIQLVCSKHDERIHFSSSNYKIQSTGCQTGISVAPGFPPSCFDYDFDAQKLLEQITQYSLQMAAHLKYDNVGSWEWLVTRSGKPYLLKVNSCITAENDISARTSVIHDDQPNLIREQIRLSLGKRIGCQQSAIQFKGAALQLNIAAEDTAWRFAPVPGTITSCRFPDYPWSAVYSHIPDDKPYPIPSEFDPNLALAVIWGDSLEDAKTKAKTFLKKTVIRGKDSSGKKIATNLDYFKKNLGRILAC